MKLYGGMIRISFGGIYPTYVMFQLQKSSTIKLFNSNNSSAWVSNLGQR